MHYKSFIEECLEHVLWNRHDFLNKFGRVNFKLLFIYFWVFLNFPISIPFFYEETNLFLCVILLIQKQPFLVQTDSKSTTIFKVYLYGFLPSILKEYYKRDYKFRRFEYIFMYKPICKVNTTLVSRRRENYSQFDLT